MPDEAVLFEAELRPHRSLSRAGTLTLLAALGGASLAITTLFWSLGAWPIAGFNGADIGLACLLLHLSQRSGRARDRLRLTAHLLRIERWDGFGHRTAREFSPDWLRVSVEERTGRVPAVYLVARGVREELAEALGEADKRAFAAALDDALHRLRHPRFDNPQLGTP